MKALSLLRKKKSKGFTLVELVIVIAVLAIIAAIAIPTVNGVVSNANKATDASNIQAYAMTLKTFQAEKESNSTHPLIGSKASLAGASGVDELFAAYGIVLTKPKTDGTKVFIWNTADQTITIGDYTEYNLGDTEVALFKSVKSDGKLERPAALSSLNIGL